MNPELQPFEELQPLLIRGQFVRWWREHGDIQNIEAFEAAWAMFINGYVVILRDK